MMSECLIGIRPSGLIADTLIWVRNKGPTVSGALLFPAII
jgi:hypothetical protein